jgi:hypothetical protein
MSNKLYIEGSPIIIEAGALQKDNVTNKVLVQLKLRNISNRKIVACEVRIRAFAPGEKELEGVDGFTYLDVNKATGEAFGVKIPIYLPNDNTRKFTVTITEVVFGDDSVWTSQAAEWIVVPKQNTIGERLDDKELIKQYEIEICGNCSFYPEVSNGLFMCTCGTLNMASSRCYKCGRNYTELIETLDETTLKVKCEERLKKEKEKRKAAEQQAAKEAEETRRKLKKVLKIALPIAVILIVIAALTPTLIKPAVTNALAYHNANKLLSSGDYEGAKEAFEELGDYKDASDMVTESIYQKASELMSQEKYLEAADAFGSLEGYKNAEELFVSASYMYACDLLESGDYVESMVYFDNAEGYEDADELRVDAIYYYANQLFYRGNYAEAKDYFEECLPYLDDAEMLDDVKYKLLCLGMY